jgi:hypothetical protein
MPQKRPKRTPNQETDWAPINAAGLTPYVPERSKWLM